MSTTSPAPYETKTYPPLKCCRGLTPAEVKADYYWCDEYPAARHVLKTMYALAIILGEKPKEADKNKPVKYEFDLMVRRDHVEIYSQTLTVLWNQWLGKYGFPYKVHFTHRRSPSFNYFPSVLRYDHPYNNWKWLIGEIVQFWCEVIFPGINDILNAHAILCDYMPGCWSLVDPDNHKSRMSSLPVLRYTPVYPKPALGRMPLETITEEIETASSILCKIRNNLCMK